MGWLWLVQVPFGPWSKEPSAGFQTLGSSARIRYHGLIWIGKGAGGVPTWIDAGIGSLNHGFRR